jgi:hypothetical protein
LPLGAGGGGVFATGGGAPALTALLAAADAAPDAAEEAADVAADVAAAVAAAVAVAVAALVAAATACDTAFDTVCCTATVACGQGKFTVKLLIHACSAPVVISFAVTILY